MIYRINQGRFRYASNLIQWQPDAGCPGTSRCHSSIVTGIEVALDLISRSYHAEDHPRWSRSVGFIRRRFHRDADRFCKGCVVRMEEVTIRHNGNGCYDELNARERREQGYCYPRNPVVSAGNGTISIFRDR